MTYALIFTCTLHPRTITGRIPPPALVFGSPRLPGTTNATNSTWADNSENNYIYLPPSSRISNTAILECSLTSLANGVAMRHGSWVLQDRLPVQAGLVVQGEGFVGRLFATGEGDTHANFEALPPVVLTWWPISRFWCCATCIRSSIYNVLYIVFGLLLLQ